jgi:Tfp pilus assembly protein PilV
MRRAEFKAMVDTGSRMLHQAAGIQYSTAARKNAVRKRSITAFALYEVMLGVIIFVIGVLALGRSVQNCLNASTLNAEEDRVRQILSNRMAEIQVTPGPPDTAKLVTIETGYGPVKLVQKSMPAQLTEADGTNLIGVRLVTLTAQWTRGGATQSKTLQFYVYRAG